MTGAQQELGAEFVRPLRFGDPFQCGTSHFPPIKDAWATAPPSAQHSHLSAGGHLHRTDSRAQACWAAGGEAEPRGARLAHSTRSLPRPFEQKRHKFRLNVDNEDLKFSRKNTQDLKSTVFWTATQGLTVKVFVMATRRNNKKVISGRNSKLVWKVNFQFAHHCCTQIVKLITEANFRVLFLHNSNEKRSISKVNILPKIQFSTYLAFIFARSHFLEALIMQAIVEVIHMSVF